MRHLLAILCAAVLLLPSCTEKLSKRKGLTDTNLYSGGQQKLAKKKYGDAIEHFQVLLERFPTSALAAPAQLALADARMENGDDLEAEIAYDDFLRLYPASDNVPYALFRKGELLSRQAGKPGRDQTKTLEALRTYKLLLEKSPSSPYAGRAAGRIGELRNRLAEHEVRVVSHYLTRKKYDARRRGRAGCPTTRTRPPSRFCPSWRRRSKGGEEGGGRRSEEKPPGENPAAGEKR